MTQHKTKINLTFAALAAALSFATATPSSAQSFGASAGAYGAELTDVGFKVVVKKKHHARSNRHRAHRSHRSSRHHFDGHRSSRDRSRHHLNLFVTKKLLKHKF